MGRHHNLSIYFIQRFIQKKFCNFLIVNVSMVTAMLEQKCESICPVQYRSGHQVSCVCLILVSRQIRGLIDDIPGEFNSQCHVENLLESVLA